MLRKIATAICLALASGPAQADVLQEIADRGVIRLGVRSDAPPFSYTDVNGAPAGLAVRICDEVARLISRAMEKRNLGIDHVVVNAQDRFPALIEGRTDLHCGPASATLTRRATLDFSILYFVDGAAAAVRMDGPDMVFDITGGKLGVLRGTTTEIVVEDLIQRNNMNAEIIRFTAHTEGLAALAAGGIDSYFGDQAILDFQIEKMALTEKVAILEDTFSFEPYALVMRRGEDTLRLAVDTALSEIYDRGLIYQMILDEMGNYPLSPEARAVYQIVGLPE